MHTFNFQISSNILWEQDFPLEFEAEDACLTSQGKQGSLCRILKAVLCKMQLQRFVLQYKHGLIIFVSSISQFAFPYDNLTLFVTYNLFLKFSVIRVSWWGLQNMRGSIDSKHLKYKWSCIVLRVYSGILLSLGQVRPPSMFVFTDRKPVPDPSVDSAAQL